MVISKTFGTRIIPGFWTKSNMHAILPMWNWIFTFLLIMKVFTQHCKISVSWCSQTFCSLSLTTCSSKCILPVCGCGSLIHLDKCLLCPRRNCTYIIFMMFYGRFESKNQLEAIANGKKCVPYLGLRLFRFTLRILFLTQCKISWHVYRLKW